MGMNDRDVIQGARGRTPLAPTAFLASIRGNPQGSILGAVVLVTFAVTKVTRAPSMESKRTYQVLRE